MIYLHQLLNLKKKKNYSSDKLNHLNRKTKDAAVILILPLSTGGQHSMLVTLVFRVNRSSVGEAVTWTDCSPADAV